MVDILERTDAYYASPAVSQSKLKALMSGIGTYIKESKDEFKEDPEHFILGTGVDISVLTPTIFNDVFFVAEDLEKKPSDTIKSIIREVHHLNPKINHLESLGEDIYNAANSREYYLNRKNDDWEKDKRIPSIINDGEEYWKQLIKTNGRTILSTEEAELIKLMSETLQTHKHTSEFFEDHDNWIKMTQIDIYFTHKDRACKALLDYIIIDTENKTIQPIDIKTIGQSTKAFPFNAKKLRYDIQGSWYTLALNSIDTLEINEYHKIDMSEYTILPFKFIVESTSSPGICPLVYTMTPSDLNIGRYGAFHQQGYVTENYNSSMIAMHTKGNNIYGYEEALDRYIWHEENAIWDMDKDIYEANGKMVLEIWN